MRLLTNKKINALIIIFILLPFCLLSWNIYNVLTVPMLKKSDSPVLISLDTSTSAYQFVTNLNNKKLIQSKKIVLLFIRFKGFANQLKAGVYQINPGDTVLQLLNKVIAGEVIAYNFTIVAGTTQKKIGHDLELSPYIHYNEHDWSFIQDNHPNSEGLLLADTYRYHAGSSSKLILERSHHDLMVYLNQAWASRDIHLPYNTAYELLIAASIIEKETAIPTERQLISGVLVNRLKKSMMLQMDPTVIYGLGESYHGKLVHKDLQVDSPYNTYRNRGLPPTPIAMVGKEAIDAAAHPQLSNYLYYVAKGDGSHQFSQSYGEQRQAIQNYRHKDL